MSVKHPIIAVTGSSGVKRDSVRKIFNQIFRREGVLAAFVAGESFHKYSRTEMKKAVAEAAAKGNFDLSHFGPEANVFGELENLYRSYGENGTGQRRIYLHTDEEAEAFSDLGLKPGDLTPWEDMPPDTDCLVYEGLHGWVKSGDVALEPLTDLRVGMVPIINLEWIQKIDRDTKMRGYSTEAVVDTMLRRMHDYVHYVIPQFKRSDINFQKVPVVDTSYPMIAREVPSDDECMVVIRFRKPEEFGVDFPFLLRELKNSWMSRRNTIVVQGGKMNMAMELILTPIVRDLMAKRKKALAS
ncbi:MAG: phosphoribulokinase [Magnetospirillum sp. WYHS-4]